ncbi:MAG: hypothetical protein VX998_04960 [Candidatus Thermoplasmatota archaeon]|nr:hypothetical protein [Candidatus Thermoplasmatota archaeon]MEC8588620.1 hypothetical protein [Candidatus Thermoplasmatota archaeon]|tara:strand:- start:51 stop:488 length:438 start_codon:yes stop_codon:yes gene_type:complete
MSATDSMVTLQERMVNLIGQLTMPVAEVALVLQHHIQGLLGSLNEYVKKTGASISEQVAQPWPIEENNVEHNSISFDVEKVLKIVDQDRMDILSTLIRVTLVETEMDLVEGILALRSWEQLVRQQLADATGPGQLFSPIELPEEW